MRKRKATQSKKRAAEIWDLIEVQYWLAEAKGQLNQIDDHLSTFGQKEQSLQQQLLEVQTQIGELRRIAKDVENSISELKELEPLLLSEVDAVETLKAAYRQGKVNIRLELYATESEIEFLRMQKALNTVRADYYAYPDRDAGFPGYEGLYTIEIDAIPESYSEFLYGVEAVPS